MIRPFCVLLQQGLGGDGWNGDHAHITVIAKTYSIMNIVPQRLHCAESDHFVRYRSRAL